MSETSTNFLCDGDDLCYFEFPPVGCPLIYPQRTKSHDVLKASTCTYFTFAKGNRSVYTNLDKLVQYNSSDILDPSEASYYNLFINGVLQPENTYFVEEGLLKLLSIDFPLEGSPIILQYIIILFPW